MKKSWCIFTALWLAVPLLAASNCVSRVDKNLQKSTTQKVDLCLQQDEQTSAAPQETTEVFLSDTYSVKYPSASKKSTEKTAKPSYKSAQKYQQDPVSYKYIDRPNYPAFRNDITPRMGADQAHQTAMQALQGSTAVTSKSKKAKKPAKKSKKSKKPARQLEAPVAAAETEQTAAEATPEAEIEQAQALQNDPLATNSTDNGQVPEGFLDDGVMAPADFGYNATDPAFQQ